MIRTFERSANNMIEYKVLADDPQKGLVVQGNFAPGSIPVNIPHSNPKRKQYISLFLNLRDIEAGIDYLQCISPNNHLRINEGLFISALALSANAENMGVEEVRPRRPRFVIGYGNHRLCRWRHPVKALALSIKRSELQVEVLIKELATSRT